MALECRVPAAVEGTQINHHGAAFGEVSVYKSEELESKLRKVSEMRRPWVAMDPLRRILISIFPSSPAKLTQISLLFIEYRIFSLHPSYFVTIDPQNFSETNR
jgi:hypothetical protein